MPKDIDLNMKLSNNNVFNMEAIPCDNIGRPLA